MFFNDLLPLPYNTATLARVCDHVDHVQKRLGRRMLLENPSTYVEFSASTMSESGSCAKWCAAPAAACCSTSIMYVSCANHGRDAGFIDELPLEAVGEIHLGRLRWTRTAPARRC